MTIKVIFIFFLAVAFYGVKLSLLPVDIYRLVYIPCIVTLIFFIVYRRERVPTEIVNISLFFLLSLSFSVFVLLYTESNDLTVVRMHVDYIISILAVSYVIALILINMKIDIVSAIIIMAFIQACLMLLMISFPAFQKLILNLIDVDGIKRAEGGYRFRGVGFTGLATYSMAVVQSFSLFLFPLYWSRSSSSWRFIASCIVFITICISTLISARTSIIFIVSLFFYFLYIIVFSSMPILKRRIVLVVFSSIAFISIGFIYLASAESNELATMYNWGTELYRNFSESGSVRTESTDALATLYFMPEQFTLILGDGVYINETGGYYMSTDVGYIRIALYGGVFGSFLFYFSFAFLMYVAYIQTKERFGRQFAYGILIYSVLIFLVNAKGSIFFDGFIAIKLLILYTISLLVGGQKVINNE